MALTDYTFICTLGQTCATNFQLSRAAVELKVPRTRCVGPFDWISVNIKQMSTVIESDFADYFSQDIRVSPEQNEEDGWWIVERNGIPSRHQLTRHEGEREPSGIAWFEFGKWLGRRIEAWHHHVSQSSGNLLFVRHEDPFRPDDPKELQKLVELLERKVSGQFSLAWVRFSPRREERVAPQVKTFTVRPAWPEHLSSEEIDWMRDYGAGVAWRGRNEDWDRVWREL